MYWVCLLLRQCSALCRGRVQSNMIDGIIGDLRDEDSEWRNKSTPYSPQNREKSCSLRVELGMTSYPYPTRRHLPVPDRYPRLRIDPHLYRIGLYALLTRISPVHNDGLGHQKAYKTTSACHWPPRLSMKFGRREGQNFDFRRAVPPCPWLATGLVDYLAVCRPWYKTHALITNRANYWNHLTKRWVTSKYENVKMRLIGK